MTKKIMDTTIESACKVHDINVWEVRAYYTTLISVIFTWFWKSVTVSLDRQKDILQTLRWTQLIYLRTSNIISVTKNRLPNNTSYYRTKISLLLNSSHHWHELTINLDIFEGHSLWSTWPCTKFSNSVSNDNPLQLLHSVSADQQSELYSFSNRTPELLYLATARNQLF